MRFFVLTALFSAGLFFLQAVETQKSEADLYFQAALYSKAATCYQNILQNINDAEEASRLRLQIARCLYFDGDFSGLVSLLASESALADEEKLYLGIAYSSLCQNNMKNQNYEVIPTSPKTDSSCCFGINQYDKAAAILDAIEDPKWMDQAFFEKGKAFFHLRDFQQAEKAFSQVSNTAQHIFSLAQIYRIRTAIESGNYDAALHLLNSHSPAETLIFEWNFLRGTIALHQGNSQEAIKAFKQALPSDKVPWAGETLSSLSQAYLNSAEDPSLSLKERALYYDSAIEALKKAAQIMQTDETILALGRAYLSKGRYLDDSAALQHALDLLRKGDHFTGRDAQNEALFLTAQAAEDYEERDLFFKRLTQEKNAHSPQYGTWWLYRGLNDLGKSQELEGKLRDPYIDRALHAFEQAERFLDPKKQYQASLWKGRAYLQQNSSVGNLKAKHLFSTILNRSENIDDPAQLYYLYAQTLIRIHTLDPKDVEWLEEGLKRYPSNEGLFLLGIIYYTGEEWEKAEHQLSKVIDNGPNHLRPEALFWAGKSAAATEKDSFKTYFEALYQDYPEHPYAAEAYFSMYSFKDYLQSNRNAIDHLRQLPALFPESIYVLNAYYLIGLDHKRDRKSEDGRKIYRRDLNAAIKAFNQVEEEYRNLEDKKLIPAECAEHSASLYYYASLERALANLAIAQQSKGAKSQIFLDYAQELLKTIADEFKEKDHPIAHFIKQKQIYPAIEEESDYWLSKAYILGGKQNEATQTLHDMVERFEEANISRGYYLARAWFELGSLSLQKQEYRSAMTFFEKADEAGRGGILSTDEQLSLWIEKSQCSRGMLDFDSAIRILTQVTNENVISNLRLKAMFLRSELYALQNRPELERNQLKALAKKGGEWAQKARETLETKYGY